MKKLILLSLAAILSFSYQAKADEGMWLPHLLKMMNEKDMQAKGMKLSAEDIYNINNASIKDAIVHFGGGCTGEVISSEGLILTNHHCGYGRIQAHSTVENDYLTHGFWAMDRSQELPNPGLSVTFIVRIEDVTTKVLQGISGNITEAEREQKVAEATARIRKEATAGTGYEAIIRPFYYGSEYYMFITETFKDIRMVGAPPSSIGKFGGDTDNWMWPRHTGDFSLFRIYADKNNRPASYSPDNVPYKPKYHLPISLRGIKKGDFTMVMGFPGRTQQYLSAEAVKMIIEDSNPYKVALRGQLLDIMDEAMKSSDTLRIKYAAKHASLANAWKKWIGETRGLKKLNAVAKKQAQEAAFQAWVLQDAARRQKYGQVLAEFEKQYASLRRVILGLEYMREAALAPELLSYANAYNGYIAAVKSNIGLEEATKRILELSEGHFKDYHLPTDKKIFIAAMSAFLKDIKPELHPAIFKTIKEKYNSNLSRYADYVYNQSFMTSKAKVEQMLQGMNQKKLRQIENDPALLLINSFLINYQENIYPVYAAANAAIELNNRLYVEGLREMYPDRKFYPDANSTLRVTYGVVDGYFPVDGVYYEYYTTLEGVMEKENPAVEEFVVPPKLKELYQKKDYGMYGVNNTMPVAFIASNHTTGGNSGSPVINAEGYLIGTNFDRNWEGTMSDIMYDKDQVRNISLDIRYTLFIIDKFAGAGHLVKEMTIIR